MKRLLLILTALVGAGAMGLAFADGLGTGIATTQSPHNFTDDWCGGKAGTGGGMLCSALTVPIDEVDGLGGGWNAAEEICRVCHVPHDHNLTTNSYWSEGLLWNHKAVTTALWTPYDSGSMDATTGDPSGPSLLCLGCHDGSTAIDTFDKYATSAVDISDYHAVADFPGDGDAYKVPNTGTAGDLQGSHPISMSYYDDPSMNPDGNAMGTLTIADVLFGDTAGLTATVECSSCHDVHDQVAIVDTPLLRVDNSQAAPNASALCLTCHDK